MGFKLLNVELPQLFFLNMSNSQLYILGTGDNPQSSIKNKSSFGGYGVSSLLYGYITEILSWTIVDDVFDDCHFPYTFKIVM